MIFLKPPKFWYTRVSFTLRCILLPISRVYHFFARRNYRKNYLYHSSIPDVIAIGGITIGGSGKTVVVQSLCGILQKKIAIVSRGYGRSSNSCVKVNPDIHSAQDVGDEPLTLSKHATVFVCADRSIAAKQAELEGFDCIILDDGIMQRYLATTKRIIVIDSTQRLGNGEILPLGPNRISPDIAMGNANAICIITNDDNRNIEWLPNPQNLPVIFAKVQYDFSQITADRIIAFCGIGHPQKFFTSLSQFNVIEEITFPDHYPFSHKHINELIKLSQIHSAQLVTTEKDYMRIPKKYRQFFSFVPIKLKWDNLKMLLDAIS